MCYEKSSLVLANQALFLDLSGAQVGYSMSLQANYFIQKRGPPTDNIVLFDIPNVIQVDYYDAGSGDELVVRVRPGPINSYTGISVPH